MTAQRSRSGRNLNAGMSWSATRPREMDLKRSTSVGKEPLGVERSLNTASVKSRGLRGSLCSGEYSSASSHTAPLPSPSMPWQPMQRPRYTHSPCLSRVGFGATGAPTGSMFPVAADRLKTESGGGGALERMRTTMLVATISPTTSTTTVTEIALFNAVAFPFKCDGRPSGGRRCRFPKSSAGRAPRRRRCGAKRALLLSDGRGPAPIPCWTSTCRPPAPSWHRCSRR